MMETDLKAFLQADTGVAALVVDRIHPITLPEAQKLDSLTYHVISTQRYYALDGVATLVQARVQLDAWSLSWLGARALKEAVRSALNAFQGTMGMTEINFIALADEQEVFEDVTKQYRHISDYFIWYVES